MRLWVISLVHVGGTNMARYFTIDWTDLTFDKRQELIEEIAKEVYDEWKRDGMRLLEEQDLEPKPKTWQEAYIRIYGINILMWEDYMCGNDKREPDWNRLLGQAIEKEAENRCSKAIRLIEIEI
jgi:hypothetical protein